MDQNCPTKCQEIGEEQSRLFETDLREGARERAESERTREIEKREMRGSILVGACVGALLACSAHATELEARADVRALLRNSVRSEMDVAVAGPFKRAKEAVSGTTKAVGSAVSSTTNAVVNHVVSPVTDGLAKGFGKGSAIAKGFGKMGSYVDNQLVKDLTIVGNAIKKTLDKLVCNDAGMFAVTLSCSIAIQGAICSATKGAAPGCLPGDEVLTLTQRIVVSIGLATVSLVFRCSYYHLLKQFEPALCKGRAYGIATQVAHALVSDPYSMACSLAIGCSCGPTSCAFSCANDPGICYTETYTDAVEDFLNVLN
jgi:hypothetical protein